MYIYILYHKLQYESQLCFWWFPAAADFGTAVALNVNLGIIPCNYVHSIRTYIHTCTLMYNCCTFICFVYLFSALNAYCVHSVFKVCISPSLPRCSCLSTCNSSIYIHIFYIQLWFSYSSSLRVFGLVKDYSLSMLKYAGSS